MTFVKEICPYALKSCDKLGNFTLNEAKKYDNRLVFFFWKSIIFVLAQLYNLKKKKKIFISQHIIVHFKQIILITDLNASSTGVIKLISKKTIHLARLY